MRKNNHLSEEQLTQLKKRLFADMNKLEETIADVEKQDPFNDPAYADDNSAIDTDVREQMEHETVEAELKSLRKKHELVVNALKRMEEGTYGLDISSGEPIPYERLDIVPEASYTIENEQRLVK